MSTAAGTQTGQGFPMFYKQPEVLNSERHKGLGLKPGASYAFARETHVVPINAVEMPHAARFYPVVFTATPAPSPVAVVGLRAGQNVFINRKGDWDEATYIPAYVRRYPFVFLRNEQEKKFTLCIDRGSDRIAENAKSPFFDNGEKTEITSRALDFCSRFQAEHGRTAAICEALAGQGLFKLQTGTFTLESGQKLALRDFNVIDEEKLNGLDDEAFARLRKAGALPVIYSHLISMQAWRDLVRRASSAK